MMETPSSGQNDALRKRMEVRNFVKSCTRCPLHSQCTSPVPFRGPAPAQLAIVGEAPGKVEDKEGKPFVGPSGDYLEESLRSVGLDPAAIAFLNTVSCLPNRPSPTPTPDEVAACRINKVMQLSLIQPEFVLLLGSVALTSFYPSAKVTEVRGLFFRVSILPSAWWFATYHPAAVLRNRGMARDFLADLRLLKEVVDGEYFPPQSLYCIKCGRDGEHWDEAEFPYCEEHYPPLAGQRKGKGRKTSKTAGKSSTPPGEKASPASRKRGQKKRSQKPWQQLTLGD